MVGWYNKFISSSDLFNSYEQGVNMEAMWRAVQTHSIYNILQSDFWATVWKGIAT